MPTLERTCLLCGQTLARRRWWQLPGPVQFCPPEDQAACQARLVTRYPHLAGPDGINLRVCDPVPPDEVQQTVYGPRIDGTCSRCGGLMAQAISGTFWHVGEPACHWHIAGSDCCAFVRAEGRS